MNTAYFTLPTKRSYMAAFFALLSVLLVAYGPMTTYSQAQAISSANFASLKTKVLGELDRRIANYEETIKSLANSTTQVTTDGSISGSGLESSTKDDKGNSYNFTVDDSGIHGDIVVGTALKDTVKGFMQKVVNGLKATTDKVKSSKTMESLKALATNIDDQFIVNQATQVQAAVTQATDSMSGAAAKLKETYGNIQARAAQLEQCINKSAPSTVDCSQFKNKSQDLLTTIKAQLKNLGSVISTIKSVVMSVVTLCLSLVSQFKTMTSMLGDLGNLGSISNLSGKLGGGSALSGLMNSFSGILSQLNLARGMSSTAQGGLSSLTGLING